MKATSTASKSITVLLRVQFKSDARKVVYFVQSSNGIYGYDTCLFDGKATSCTCPARKPCKHMAGAELIEAARAAHIEKFGDVTGFNVVEAQVVVEEVAPLVEEISGEDMSVQEKMIEDELSVYERDLQEWSLASLRKSVEMSGLEVRSRSKAPLIAALVAHRKASLVAAANAASKVQESEPRVTVPPRVQEDWSDEGLVQKPANKREQQKAAIMDEWKEKYPFMAASMAKVREEARGNLHNSRRFSLMA